MCKKLRLFVVITLHANLINFNLLRKSLCTWTFLHCEGSNCALKKTFPPQDVFQSKFAFVLEHVDKCPGLRYCTCADARQWHISSVAILGGTPDGSRLTRTIFTEANFMYFTLNLLSPERIINKEKRQNGLTQIHCEKWYTTSRQHHTQSPSVSLSVSKVSR